MRSGSVVCFIRQPAAMKSGITTWHRKSFGDRRFDPDALTLARVVPRIADFAGTVVLSSEGFEGLLHRPEMLAPLVQRLRGVGREVCLVIYTRNLTGYAKSLCRSTSPAWLC